MTSSKGEDVVAPGWARVRTGLPANSPDINDQNGPLLTTSGYVWRNGVPVSSPDGGTWQNIFGGEDFAQTISGLVVGTTYYFRYYYTTQGIREQSSGSSFIRPMPPNIALTGLSGYTDPSNAGNLFEWNTYYGSLVATATSATILVRSPANTYLAYDGFYLSPTPLSFPLVTTQPQNVSLCENKRTSFSVTATGATSYQWQVNTGSGWRTVVDNAVYSNAQSNTLLINNTTLGMTNYEYRCKIDNYCCTIYSATATLRVTIPLTPALVITASPVTFCANTPIIFSAIPTNAGSSPIYQWKKNGINVGINSSNYTENAPVDGDVITCLLTSSENCTTRPGATSNAIVVTITPYVTPAISIAASNNNICYGTSVAFSATVTNGGSAPVYTWFKNGQALPGQSSTYTDNALNDGDVITCSVTPDLPCITAASVTSAPVTMVVVPLVTPSISISASATAVCVNKPVSFTASAVNGGSTPQYQWKKNGIPVGTNSNAYADNTFLNGDVVTCTLTSGIVCVTAAQVVSNAIPIRVNPDPVVRLDKTNSLCDGKTRLLDAGDFPTYLWNTGSVNRTISINGVGNYAVTVTDKNGCTGSDVTSVTQILPTPAKFLPEDTAICSYGSVLIRPNANFQQYLWQTGSGSAAIAVTQPGQYWLQVQNSEGCTGADTITVFKKDCLMGFFMPTAFTPNNDRINDVIKPVVLGNVKEYQFRIYNRWGQLVFQTTDLLSGWNGIYKGQLQNGNTFVWVCMYRFDNEPLQSKKGTFVLIR